MRDLNIEFLEEYKRVERFIRDAYGTQSGVTDYLKLMETSSPEPALPDSWPDDYRGLKRLRWIRNKLAHEVSMDSDIVGEDFLKDVIEEEEEIEIKKEQAQKIKEELDKKKEEKEPRFNVTHHEDLRTVQQVREEEFNPDNVILVRENLKTTGQIRREEEAKKNAGKNMDDGVKAYPPRELIYTKTSLKGAGTIMKKYEKQEYASNDCWSCAGPAILN
ncbi:MAG: hypothetical protein J6V01_03240, partial [Clostridia bacterium]|nr:hypothetical protein [Clostridia bacterium]